MVTALPASGVSPPVDEVVKVTWYVDVLPPTGLDKETAGWLTDRAAVTV